METPRGPRREIKPLPWRSPATHDPGREEIGDSRECMARLVEIARNGLVAYTRENKPSGGRLVEITSPEHGRWGHCGQLIEFEDGFFGVEIVDSHNDIMFGVRGLEAHSALKLMREVDSDIARTGVMEQYAREAYLGKEAGVPWENALKIPGAVAGKSAPMADGTKRETGALRQLLIARKARGKK